MRTVVAIEKALQKLESNSAGQAGKSEVFGLSKAGSFSSRRYVRRSGHSARSTLLASMSGIRQKAVISDMAKHAEAESIAAPLSGYRRASSPASGVLLSCAGIARA